MFCAFNNTDGLYDHEKLFYIHTLKFKNLRVDLSPVPPIIQGSYKRWAGISGLVASARLYERQAA
jgi:hypothetical protein